MGDQVTAACHGEIRAAHDSGPRAPGDVSLVVLHSTEGGTAAGVARFFAASSTQASTQLVVDDGGCYRCLPDEVIPWGAPGANRNGLHVEHVGYARWSREEWLRHEATLRRGAFHVAAWCRAYRIPVRLLTPEQLRRGARGIAAHAAVTEAFGTVGGHTDPGRGFPIEDYLGWVRGYLGNSAPAKVAYTVQLNDGPTKGPFPTLAQAVAVATWWMGRRSSGRRLVSIRRAVLPTLA